MKKLYSESTYKYCNSENGFLTIRIKEIYKPSSIRKRGLIPECTKSEIKKYPNSRSFKGMKILAQLRGSQNGLDMAEGFCIIKEIKR